MAEQTALVMLAPDDSIDTIIQQVKNTGATHVDLLMPDGAPALQSRKSCDKLRETAYRSGIELTFYTADPKIVKAAQTCQIMVVELDETALQPASAAAPARQAAPVSAPAAPAAPPQPRSLEEDFLASLEALPTAPSTASQRRGADTLVFEQPNIPAQKPEDDWASALDGLSIASVGGAAALRDHEKARGNDEWDFDGFNDLSDVLSGGENSSAAPSRPRIRAEDIELTKDDMNRQLSKAKREKLEKPPRTGLFGRGGATSASSMEILPEAKPGLSRSTLLIGLLLVLAVAFAIWFFRFRNPPTTVTVSPPTQRVGITTYDDVRINYDANPINDPTSAAIQGRTIELLVSVTVRGTVVTPTAQPDQTASGTIAIINRNTQDFSLAANTQVTTTNLQGQSVNYLLTQAVVVPAATQSLSGVQFGQTDAPITAVAAGEQYNVPPDTNTAWVIEGYEGPLFGVNPSPIEGGTNILLKIPTEADIRPLLNQAVPLFRQAVPEQLKTQLQAGEEVAGIDFTPDVDALIQNPELYNMTTRPIPETDGEFELVLSANFRGLAVPSQPAFADQLARALPKSLTIKEPTFNQETTDIVSSSLRLSGDGNANLLLATIVSAPKASDQAISPEVQAEIQAGLQGLTIQEAQLKLQEFYERGLIGAAYSLPEVEKLPDNAAQIKIVVQQ